jgi:hypothetical protein
VRDLTDPTTATLAVADALRAAGITGAVYGGLALGAYGEPRETKDADFAVAGTGLSEVVDALERAGVDASPSFEGVRFGGLRISRVVLLGADDSSGLNVLDIIEPLSSRYATSVLRRALTGSMRGRPVTLVSPEDFVLLKVLSTRERDVEDAGSVLRALSGRIDLALIEREAHALAAEIDDHPIAARLGRARGEA